MKSDFSATLKFDPKGTLPTVHTMGKVNEVHAIDVKGKFYPKKDYMEHGHHLLDKNLKSITLPFEVKMSKEDEKNYGESDHGFKVRNARLDEIKDQLPEVWLLNSSNLSASLYSWKTGPLSRLAKILSEKFFEDKWKFDYGSNVREMPEGIKQAHKFFVAAVKDFPYWKEILKPRFEKSLSDYLGSQTTIELNPLIQSVEEWLKQQLVLSFASQSGQALTPLDRMGDGYQSLVRLSALEVLSGLDDVRNTKNVILLYEEPETYLHAHLRRKLRNIFDVLSDKGWCIVAATHSHEFLTFDRKQNIHRMIRSQDVLLHGRIQTIKLPENIKFQEKLDEAGNHEMFFAKKVILCEGKGDLFAIRAFLDKSGIDLETAGVSILSCGSIGNIPDFAVMAKELLIPFCAVTDLDKLPDGTVKKNTEDARAKIAKIITQGDLALEWYDNLEICMNTPINNGANEKARPDWLRKNVFSKSIEDIQKTYPKFSIVCASIINWLSKTNLQPVNPSDS